MTQWEAAPAGEAAAGHRDATSESETAVVHQDATSESAAGHDDATSEGEATAVYTDATSEGEAVHRDTAPAGAVVEVDTILADGGEMGALMRALDWAATPLGPVAAWPQSLRTAVSICLTSRFPMLIWWGPELAMLYNDGYRPVLGATKHPAALGQRGRDCWPEIWDLIGPMLDGVLRSGEATWSHDQLLLLDRNGYVEECYFTFSYSPIRDESGGIGGVFTAVTETTVRVLGERRLATLRELAAQSVGAHDATEACERAAMALAANPHDLPLALLYLLDDDGARATLAATVGLATGTPAGPPREDLASDAPSGEGGHQAAPPSVDLAAEDGAGHGGTAWPLAAVARANAATLVDNLAARFGALPLSPGRLAPDAALALPVAQAGQERPAAVLICGLNPRRALDDAYRDFLGLVAGQIATAIANARAYEAERERAEALAEIDRAKTAFFSNVSHEFRTPLTLMLGPLEEALAAPLGTPLEAKREHLESAHRNSLRLLRLVNTLLDFSRLEAGRAEASFEPIDLPTYTAELASAFHSAVTRAGLRLAADCPPLPQPVYVDRDMWEKIVLNLLSNAFKFTFEGEIAVALRAAPDGAHAQLTVRDTGTGIPTSELPRLFERFHRVRGARARTHEGTGIGLALVRELVALHGGDIAVESTVGAGTTFTVTLPLGQAHLPPDRVGAARALASTALGAASFVEEALRWLPEEQAGTAPERSPEEADDGAGRLPGAPSGPSGDGSGEIAGRMPAVPAADDESGRMRAVPGMARVLLADDNADMRAYMRRLLDDRYDVEAVTNGAAALAAARQRPPDLIISDMMMPEMDGFALLRALRADPRTAMLPVILLSARAGEEATAAGLEAGADDYLVKPFAAGDLRARVGAHLALARLRRQALEAERVARAEAEATRDALRESVERQEYLLALNDMLRSLADPEKIEGAACRLLGERLDAQRAYYVAIHEAQDVAVVARDYVRGDLPSLVGQYPLAAFRWVMPLYKQGHPVVVADVLDSALVPEADRAAMVAVQIRAWVAIPLVKQGALVGALCVAQAHPREWTSKEVGLAQETAERVWAAVERARAEAAQHESRDLQQVALERLQTVQAVSDAALSHLDLPALLRRILDHVATALGADNAAILLLDEAEQTLTVHAARGPEEAQTGQMRVPVGQGVAGRIAATRQPLIVDDLRAAEPVNPLLREQMAALLGVPLLADGRLIGVMHVDSATPRRFSGEELRLLQLVADRVALALENARLYAAAVEARDRVAGLQRATAALAAAMGREEVADVIVAQGLAALGATVGVLALLDADGAGFRVVRAVGYAPEMAAAWSSFPADAALPLADAVRDRAPVVIESPQEHAARYPHLAAVQAATGDGALVAIPLLLGERVLGGLGLSFPAPRRVDGEQRAAMSALGELCAQALERARLYETERATAAAAAAERDRWRQVLNVLPVGVTIVDAAGRVEVLNQAGRDIIGLDTRGQTLPTPADADNAEYRVRRPDGSPYPPSDVPLARALRGEVVRGDQELHRHAVTGRETRLLVNSAPLCDAEGAIIGAVAVFQDITALHDLERAREEFLSSAAHDLKTPLTSVRGNAQLARRRLARLGMDEAVAAAGVAEMLTRVEEGTDAMLALINELVDVARQQMGAALELQRALTDLVALARGCAETLRGASGRTIVLETELASLWAEVDGSRVTRVLDNLLSNALKYSSHGAIRVTVAREAEAGAAEASAGWAVLAVRDEGIGIPAADLPYIFERFRRAVNVSDHVQGTGIGLASVRGIVEQHGGSVSVESVEGEGSTFTVRLPLAAPESEGT